MTRAQVGRERLRFPGAVHRALGARGLEALAAGIRGWRSAARGRAASIRLVPLSRIRIEGALMNDSVKLQCVHRARLAADGGAEPHYVGLLQHPRHPAAAGGGGPAFGLFAARGLRRLEVAYGTGHRTVVHGRVVAKGCLV